jgi:hypothetical protein
LEVAAVSLVEMDYECELGDPIRPVPHVELVLAAGGSEDDVWPVKEFEPVIAENPPLA